MIMPPVPRPFTQNDTLFSVKITFLLQKFISSNASHFVRQPPFASASLPNLSLSFSLPRGRNKLHCARPPPTFPREMLREPGAL